VCSRPTLPTSRLLDRATGTISFPYQHGEAHETLTYGEGLTSRIIDSGEALILNSDVSERSQQLGARLIGKEALSYLGVPIFVAGRCEGVISVQSTQREGAYDADDQRLLETIAANVGVAPAQRLAVRPDDARAGAARPRPPTCCRSSAARWPTRSRCSTRSWTVCARLFAGSEMGISLISDDDMIHLAATSWLRQGAAGRLLSATDRPLADRGPHWAGSRS